MQDDLILYIPKLNELWYRQKLLSDPDTMEYNKGYELGFKEYDNETGCIAFPESQWKEWYDWFIGNEPDRYYAYVVRKCDSEFVGEVNLHRGDETGWYDMGIVIEAKYKGKGYATNAFPLLLNYAFKNMNAFAVHNSFEISHVAALRTHLSAGFTEYSRHDDIIELVITNKQFGGSKCL